MGIKQLVSRYNFFEDRKLKNLAISRVNWKIKFCLLALVLLSGCGNQSNIKKNQSNQSGKPSAEMSLVFNQVTLEQADEQGRPLWKVKAKQATYSQDKKIARVEYPKGDLFQDGQLVLQITALSGEMEEDGKKIFLKGNIVATDPRNGVVMRGNELEWRPKQDLLIVRKNLTGSHKQLQASANEARYFSRSQKMELLGQIVAVSTEPVLQLKTEYLLWQIPQQLVTGNQRIQIDRYKSNIITEQVAGDRSEINLKTKIATLKNNVQLASLEPPIQLYGNQVVWNLKNQIVTSNQPVKIIHLQEKVTVTANRSTVDLENKIAFVSGGVQGTANRNQGQLYANRMTWEINTQQLQAEGNVIYRQVNPPLNLTGSTARGKIQEQTMVLTGTSGNKVITEIIPNIPVNQNKF